jgi:hypothetical protein
LEAVPYRASDNTSIMLDDRSGLESTTHLIDVSLLDHTGLALGYRFQPMAARGTKIDTMIERPVVDGLGREQIPFVFRVSGLATNFALSLIGPRERPYCVQHQALSSIFVH